MVDTKRTKTRRATLTGQPASLADDVLGEPRVTALRYHRLSHERAADAKQDTRTQRKCDELGATVLDTFADDEITAAWDPTVDDEPEVRPGFDKLLAAIAEHEPTYVVTRHPNRLTRNAVDYTRFVRATARLGVVLVTERGTFDMSDPQDRSRLLRHCDDDANYVAAIAEGLKSANADRRELLMPKIGGQRPYGLADDRLTPKPDEARVIRWLAQRVLAGASLSSLADELNAKGTPPPSVATANAAYLDKRKRTLDGMTWYQTTVRALLERPSTAGLLAYKGEVLGEFAPVAAGEVGTILDRDTYDRVQVALAKRTAYRTPQVVTGSYWLTGLLVCACGGRMFGATRGQAAPAANGGGVERLRKYRCEHNDCTIAADDIRVRGGGSVFGIESLAREAVVTLGSDPSHMHAIAEAAESRSQEWHAAHERVAELERELDELATGRDEDGNRLPLRFVAKRSAAVEQDLAAAKRVRDRLTPPDASLEHVRAQARSRLVRAWELASPTERRAMVASVIGGFRVLPAGKGKRTPAGQYDDNGDLVLERVELIARH